MLRNRRYIANVILSARTLRRSKAYISSSAPSSSQGPNAPLELDPSLQDLLRDAEMSLLKYKPQTDIKSDASTLRELEILDFDESWQEQTVKEPFDEVDRKEKKSARAKFGSRGIGSVFIPLELRNAIDKMIESHDKHTLYQDAKRLFQGADDETSNTWDSSYDPQYKSRQQRMRHAEGDGTAFASVALPAHYSAVYAVLDNVKHRLGDNWKVQHILEWGSGVGSGLWASMHAFQSQGNDAQHSLDDPLFSQSSIKNYLGIDKRDGLSTMAKKLIQEMDVGSTSVRWQRGFTETDQITRTEGGNVVALSAFHLSSLSTSVARKELVKQMWSSGANVIILIDHDSTPGFEGIAEARELLLRMGRKEFEDPTIEKTEFVGCHVVAPCPHDGACPLYHSGPKNLICSFSQRLQRPSFLRKTKHVRAGHEDVGYTYVVIKRGQRPTSASSTVISDNAKDSAKLDMADPNAGQRIRLEAYDWPRLVFPPLKKSGHVILDGCTKEGQIMRLTIPRSQGKQPYYDARKSSWGDIFPHGPKNAPQIRFQATGGEATDVSALPGADIGKRRLKRRDIQKTSYDNIAADLKESKKNKRRNWARISHADDD